MDRFSKFFEQFQFVGPCRTETSFEISCAVTLQRGINFIDSIARGARRWKSSSTDSRLFDLENDKIKVKDETAYHAIID